MHQGKSFPSRKNNPYAAIGVGGLRQGHRLWGIVGRLGSWLWLNGEVGRESPQRSLILTILSSDRPVCSPVFLPATIEPRSRFHVEINKAT